MWTGKCDVKLVSLLIVAIPSWNKRVAVMEDVEETWPTHCPCFQ